jgi:2-phospho-L-lactate guanylyltransferase (CobY/MobA/RfbA family)
LQLGLEKISEEERNNLMTLMVDTVINRVAIKTMDILDEDDKNKYKKMYIEESERLREELKKVTPEIDKKIKEISKNKR